MLSNFIIYEKKSEYGHIVIETQEYNKNDRTQRLQKKSICNGQKHTLICQDLWREAKYLNIKCTNCSIDIPYYPNGNLQESFDYFEQEKMINVLISIGQQIIALNQKGYIHCDIKLENVMLTKDYKPQLIDFGMTRKFKELRKEHFINRTKYNLPPELFTKTNQKNFELLQRQQFQRLDSYSWGVMIYDIQNTGVLSRNSTLNDIVYRLTRFNPTKRISISRGLKLLKKFKKTYCFEK